MYESTAGAQGLCLASLRCSLCPVRFAGGKCNLSIDAPSECIEPVAPPAVVTLRLPPPPKVSTDPIGPGSFIGPQLMSEDAADAISDPTVPPAPAPALEPPREYNPRPSPRDTGHETARQRQNAAGPGSTQRTQPAA